MTPLLELQDCAKRYGDIIALAGVSFDVASGSVVTILGPNGSGKTTLMRAVGATLRLDAGRILVDGMDVRTSPRAVKARIGVVHQEDTLDPDLSVRENLELYAGYFGLSRAASRLRATELLERFALSPFVDRPIAHLSGGMRRRLALARAFIRARLLILDEPTTGLDPEARLALWSDIRALLGEGVGVLLTTHDMEEAERLSDRVILLDRGRIRTEGTAAELIARETAGRVFEVRLPVPRLGEAPELEASLRLLVNGGENARVRRHGGFLFVETRREAELRTWAEARKLALTVRPANLGDVYLAATGRSLDE